MSRPAIGPVVVDIRPREERVLVAAVGVRDEYSDLTGT
jgi:hypothetical protein